MFLFDDQFLPHALAMIDTAKSSVDISTFKAEITSKPRGLRLFEFFHKLRQKKENGVRVRFLINYHDDKRVTPKTNQYAITFLKNHKIDIKSLTHNRCCHAKVIIVDKEKAIVGSHNLSVKSVHNNFEISYLITDPVNICFLQVAYDRIFSAAKTP